MLCISTLQAQVITVGGNGNSTANIRMRVNSGGNFQVKYNGSNQIFESTTDDPDSGTSGVPGTLSGDFLSYIFQSHQKLRHIT